MKALIYFWNVIFGRLPFCSLVGLVIGSIAGSLFGVFQFQSPLLTLTWQQVLVGGMLLGAVGFLYVLLLFGLWLRFGVGQIFLPALANGLITGVLTVAVNNLLHFPRVGAIVGLIIGILVGAALCWFCWFCRPIPGRH